MTDQQALDEQLSALIDGELDARDAARLRGRLAEDPALAARLAQLEGVDEALRALPVPELSSALQQALRDRIGLEQSEEQTEGHEEELRNAEPTRSLSVWAAVPLAAAAALAVYLVLPDASVDPVQVDLADVTDEELGIARDYETLADLDVIEDLELLEWMMQADAQTDQEAERG